MYYAVDFSKKKIEKKCPDVALSSDEQSAVHLARALTRHFPPFRSSLQAVGQVCVSVYVCVFITAVPIIKLFLWCVCVCVYILRQSPTIRLERESARVRETEKATSISVYVAAEPL